MVTLDRSKPYGEICGKFHIPNAVYEQGPYFFNSAGEYVGKCKGARHPDKTGAATLEAARDRISTIEDVEHLSKAVMDMEDIPAMAPDLSDNYLKDLEANTIYGELHWRKLKKLVEAKGKKWTNKADALKLLREE